MGSVDFSATSSRDDLESDVWQLSNSRLRSLFKGRMQSGQQHLGSLVRQLDSLFCTGAVFLRRNSTARIWSGVYLVCLHLWVMYILTSHSPVSDDSRSGAVVSLQSINNTGGVWFITPCIYIYIFSLFSFIRHSKAVCGVSFLRFPRPSIWKFLSN